MNKYKLVKNNEWKEIEIDGKFFFIPYHWMINSLDKLCSKIKDGTHGSYQDYEGNEYKLLLSAKNIKKSSLFLSNNERKISISNYNEITKNGFPQKNDVLMTIVGTIGELMIWNKENPEAFQRSVSFLRVNSAISSQYLYFSLKSFYVKEEIQNRIKVGAQPGIYLNDLKSLPIKVPPITQQSAIADILSTQESVIENIEQLISKYESRFQYLSEELLSGRLRVKEVEGQLTLYKNSEDNWKEVEVNGEMKEIPKDWDFSKVSDIFEIQRGKVLSKDYIQANTGFYPVYSSATENEGSIGNINSYMFDGEYLTWTTDGVYAGTVFYRSGKFNCTNICGILKDKTENSLKGLFYFIKNELPKHVNHIGNSKLMSNTVSEIYFIYPQVYEQFIIAKLLTQQENLITQQKDFLNKEKQKFDWLLDNLLSGKYLVQDQ